MVENRHTGIPWLNFNPASEHPFDLEVLRMSDLRNRVDDAALQSIHRYGFQLVVCVTRGQCAQMLDFEPVCCKTGSVLSIRSGQVHRFGSDDTWDGWLILFRPEFLPPSVLTCPTLSQLADLESLSSVLHADPQDMAVLDHCASQMQRDSGADQPAELRAVLLRHQLCTFLVRLAALEGNRDTNEEPASGVRTRYDRFEQLLERNFRHSHKVADYAHELGCSEKSLIRATQQVKGVSPKAMLSARIILEAKRLLAHGRASVAEIGYGLGFAEPTNFVKFFRRETATTPAEFRKAQTDVTRFVDSQ
ncbi:AraC family transcriptional regulator [Leisingera sp. ANG59]|uniref:helix-turn-helix domain-containing protein n=1 Tax=Leisingera sp. ANG59 TaxID=2675221 RepID=UPI001573DB64|nr:AraC family transcriptional regulator [Leisingera sp. ANG59]